MKRIAEIISDLSRIFFAAAVFCSFLPFFALIFENNDAFISPLWPVLFLAVVFIVGRIAARRELAMLKYVIIQIIIIAAGVAGIQYFLDCSGDVINLRALMAVCFVIDAGICAKTAVSEVKTEALVHRFDVCIIILILVILAHNYLKIRALSTAMFMNIAALIILLVAVIAMRTEKKGTSGNKAGVMIPVILFVIIIAAAVLIGTYGEAGAGSSVSFIIGIFKTVFGAIGTGLKFLWTQWNNFCLWIASFIEEKEFVPIELENTEQPDDIIEPAEFSHTSVVVFYILSALAVIAILFAIINVLRKLRVKKRRTLGLNNRASERSGSSWASIKAFLDSLMLRIRYRLYTFRYRNTPTGLLIWCEINAPRQQKRKQDESGPGFLRRLSRKGPDEEKDALLKLAELVEESFYSNERPAADSALCRAVRSCRFRDAGAD